MKNFDRIAIYKLNGSWTVRYPSQIPLVYVRCTSWDAALNYVNHYLSKDKP